jgi:hypothetical protein
MRQGLDPFVIDFIAFNGKSQSHSLKKNKFCPKGKSIEIKKCFPLHGKINIKGLRDLGKHSPIVECVWDHELDFVMII